MTSRPLLTKVELSTVIFLPIDQLGCLSASAAEMAMVIVQDRVDKDKIITGADIEEGDILIGLRSSGIHSNGLSLARRAIFEEGGFSIDDKMPNSDITIGEELLKPTQLYVKAIVELLKHDFNIKGLVFFGCVFFS